MQGFPGGSEVKASACNTGDLGLIPGLGRSPGEGIGNPLQYSCLENPMDEEAWWATVHRAAKSQTRLSDFTFTFIIMLLWILKMLKNKGAPGETWGVRSYLSWVKMGERIFLGEITVGIKGPVMGKKLTYTEMSITVLFTIVYPADSLGLHKHIFCSWVQVTWKYQFLPSINTG